LQGFQDFRVLFQCIFFLLWLAGLGHLKHSETFPTVFGVTSGGVLQGIAFGTIWDASGLWGGRERERERNIQGFCEAPMSYHQCSKHHCHMQDLFWTTKQQQQLLHHRMEKREVNQEEFAATCFCVHPQFQLYPSTTFAVRRSSQNTPDRYSRGGTQRPRQLWAFLCCLFLSVYCHFLTVRVFCLQKSLGSFAMVGSPIREVNWTSNLSEFTCQCSHPGCTFWCQSCCFLSLSLSLSLGCYLSCPGLNLAEILFRSFALVGL
jgi:hypothetical protein